MNNTLNLIANPNLVADWSRGNMIVTNNLIVNGWSWSYTHAIELTLIVLLISGFTYLYFKIKELEKQ
jgi:uncharacterized membrane protein